MPVFTGRNAVEVCSHHLHTEPTPPAERLGRAVSPRLQALLLACLDKDPEKRPAGARALIARLTACDDVLPWTEKEATAWWMRHPPSERRKATVAYPSSTVGTLSVVTKGRREAAPLLDLQARPARRRA